MLAHSFDWPLNLAVLLLPLLISWALIQWIWYVQQYDSLCVSSVPLQEPSVERLGTPSREPRTRPLPKPFRPATKPRLALSAALNKLGVEPVDAVRTAHRSFCSFSHSFYLPCWSCRMSRLQELYRPLRSLSLTPSLLPQVQARTLFIAP